MVTRSISVEVEAAAASNGQPGPGDRAAIVFGGPANYAEIDVAAAARHRAGDMQRG
jgi:hypothetical protein